VNYGGPNLKGLWAELSRTQKVFREVESCVTSRFLEEIRPESMLVDYHHKVRLNENTGGRFTAEKTGKGGRAKYGGGRIRRGQRIRSIHMIGPFEICLR